jgi:K+-transporting ATPase KdpF subunit
VSVENAIGLVVSVLLVGYLVVALLFPERFECLTRPLASSRSAC